MHVMTYGIDHRALVLRRIDHCAGKPSPRDLILSPPEQAKQSEHNIGSGRLPSIPHTQAVS
jgi:hypothetical protein